MAYKDMPVAYKDISAAYGRGIRAQGQLSYYVLLYSGIEEQKQLSGGTNVVSLKWIIFGETKV